MDKSILDHYVIIIKHKVIDRDPKPFRTLDVWRIMLDL